MPRFHKLTNNESDFPHISNIDVYKYDNDFDYERFNATQMELQICTVPWDVGEAHVGQRTISGIGNVVWFETKEKRDSWFNAIPDDECYRFETKFKELHRDMLIDVPIPYDMCAKHNYLRVKYNLFANDESPVMYESDTGLREWFWFIREVEFVAPNTTRLHLLDDAFQTWMYDVNISGMILERGHAPMFSISADEFLENPIERNEYLLTEDVNFGSASQVKHTDALVLNSSDMYACIATTADNQGVWGVVHSNTWKTPATPAYVNAGVPSVYLFAVDADNLITFLNNVEAQYPQFKQSVQGIFFASSRLVSVTRSYTFAGVTCFEIAASRKTVTLSNLDKSDFGYDAKYSDIAKLYTYPYAHIEITDENGDIDIVHIEDTTGKIDVSLMLSLAYPFINIESHLLGVGGSAGGSITYRNIDEHTFNFGGQWYDTLKSWKVPTFAVILDAGIEYDYSTYYDRIQREIDYETAQTNANALADTDKTNADATADTMKTNADASADMSKTNADASADMAKTNANRDSANLSANSQIARDTATEITTTIHNPTVEDINTANNNKIDSDAAVASSVTLAQTAASNDFAAVSNGYSQAASVGSAAVGAIGSLTGVGQDGASVVGGLVGIAKSEIGAIASNAITTQAIVKDQQIAYAIADANAAYALNSTTLNDLISGPNGYILQENAKTTAAQNSSVARQTTNTVNTLNSNATDRNTTEKANATRTQSVEKANATRNRDTIKANATRSQTTAKANASREASRAQSAIDNDIRQAGLKSPFVYGAFADGDTAVTKPMALFANIVTQSKSAISSAGDEFLRYGYRFDKQWDFDGDWNVGKHYTYWKLRDFWVSNLNVPDMYMDKLRFFLFGGVTVWRKPEDIGKVSIYDNF